MNVSTSSPRLTLAKNTFEAAWEAVKAQLVAPAHQLTFFVPGKPQGELRHRAANIGGHARMYKNEKTVEARHEVLVAFRSAYPEWEAWSGPTKLDVIDCHSGPEDVWTGKHCVTKPDVDNSAKLVLDALKGFAWTDDARTTIAVPAKTYFAEEGKWVRISFFHPVPKPLNGRVKHPEVAERWDYYAENVLLGRSHKVGGRYHTVAYEYDEDGDLVRETVVDPSHKSGNWSSLTAAEAAVRACSQLIPSGGQAVVS